MSCFWRRDQRKAIGIQSVRTLLIAGNSPKAQESLLPSVFFSLWMSINTPEHKRHLISSLPNSMEVARWYFKMPRWFLISTCPSKSDPLCVKRIGQKWQKKQKLDIYIYIQSVLLKIIYLAALGLRTFSWRGRWDLVSWSGIEDGLPALEYGILAPRPQGKSLS